MGRERLWLRFPNALAGLRGALRRPACLTPLGPAICSKIAKKITNSKRLCVFTAPFLSSDARPFAVIFRHERHRIDLDRHAS